MFAAAIDCGTTNTRVYIIDETGMIFGRGARRVGVRDTSMSGSRELLKAGLKEAFDEALESSGMTLGQLGFAISAGMITSEIGLVEIPHVWAPAGVDDLAAHIVRIDDRDIFPVDLPIYLIPGIKNRYTPETVSLDDINMLDFMRGEEVQAAGLMALDGEQTPRTLVMLSSHTKFIPINEKGKILGSVTSLSGQLYAALKKETSLGKSITPPSSESTEEYRDFFSPGVADIAFSCVEESGLLRALLMSRFMDVLLSTSWYERRLFIEAALAADDSSTLNRFESLGFPLDTTLVFAGSPRRCKIYEHIFSTRTLWRGEVTSITNPGQTDRLNIHGSLFVAKRAQILC